MSATHYTNKEGGEWIPDTILVPDRVLECHPKRTQDRLIFNGLEIDALKNQKRRWDHYNGWTGL